jgi:hypothetical protein
MLLLGNFQPKVCVDLKWILSFASGNSLSIKTLMALLCPLSNYLLFLFSLSLWT